MEHSFPLPDTEAHKLDDVKYGLEHPALHTARRLVYANPWSALVTALAAGLLVGLVVGKRS